MTENNEKSKKVSWNLSSGIITEISQLRSRANYNFINRKFALAFQTLVSMKNTAIQSFSKNERTELEKIEEKFNKVSSALSISNFDFEMLELKATASNLCQKFYNQYNEILMDTLELKGYLISEEVDVSKMKF